VAEHCVSVSASVGLGSDVIIEGKGMAGSGVWLDESMAHVAVFGGR
jgi:hypothetical protein